MRRRWKSRLGVSTIIANMFMILITLSLAAILVAWAGTTYGAFTGGTQVFFGQRGQALQERFVVEEVFFNKGSSLIFVYVRNVGVEQINIVAFYVNGTSMTPESGPGLCTIPPPSPPTPPGYVLPVQSVCEFQLHWIIVDPNCSGSTSTWCTGDLFNVIVATGRGNQATFTARGP